jgi:hypothetical protein
MTLQSEHGKTPPPAGFVVIRNWRLRRYSLQRLKTSEPLVPPKPNEFDSA